MTTPELAGKFNVDSGELQSTFDFFNAHHLAFVTRIIQRRLENADPAAVAAVTPALATAAAPAVGVSPAVLSLILQVLSTFEPVIYQIISAFLTSIVPTPAPTPKPVLKPTPAVIATAIIGAVLFLFGTPALGDTCKCENESECVCPPGKCQCLNCAGAAKHDTAAAARAALALALSLQGAVDLRPAPKPDPDAPGAPPAPPSKEVTHECVCTKSLKGTCDCKPECDCDCPDGAMAYAAAYYRARAAGVPVIVWVKHAVDRTVYPEAVHCRWDACPQAKPGIVVGVCDGADLRRFDIPLAQGHPVGRQEILSAIGIKQVPQTIQELRSCPSGQCVR